jgi:hypothetical protein
MCEYPDGPYDLPRSQDQDCLDCAFCCVRLSGIAPLDDTASGFSRRERLAFS